MKTVIIKWNPLYSEVSMFDLWSDIRALNFGRLYSEDARRWPIGHQQEVSQGDEFFIVKLGFGPQGIIGHGFVCSQSIPQKRDVGLEKNRYYVEVEFSTLINPATLPILTVEDLYQAIPTCDWKSEFCTPLTEPETLQLNQMWQSYIMQYRDTFLQYNICSDSVYRNDFITGERDCGYSPKTVLIKWNPNTSPLSIDKLCQEWGDFPISDSLITWPINTPRVFSRYDRVFITMVGTEPSGLLFIGELVSSFDTSRGDSNVWVQLRVKKSKMFGKDSLQMESLTMDEIVELLPRIKKNNQNEEIVLSKEEEKQLLEKLYSKVSYALPLVPSMDYLLKCDF